MKVHQHKVRVYDNTAMKRPDFKQELTLPNFFSIILSCVNLFKDYLVLDKCVFQISLRKQSQPKKKPNIS